MSNSYTDVALQSVGSSHNYLFAVPKLNKVF